MKSETTNLDAITEGAGSAGDSTDANRRTPAGKPNAKRKTTGNLSRKKIPRTIPLALNGKAMPHRTTSNGDGSRPVSLPRPRQMRKKRDLHNSLVVSRLEKSFKGRQVVANASLAVSKGEAVGLLGPNGAGKTTIFYMIMGLIAPDSGAIRLDNNDITRLPMYQRARLGIGYLPQEASIFRGLNVQQNIRAVLEVTEPDKKLREQSLNSLLREFSIEHLRDAPAIALSGGERRRVEIARALAGKPAYMLLDEPFAGVDPIAIGDIQNLVRHLTRRGIGVLITDHNVREILGLVDRASIIHSGQVLMSGSPTEIVNNVDVRRLYLGDRFTL